MNYEEKYWYSYEESLHPVIEVSKKEMGIQLTVHFSKPDHHYGHVKCDDK